MNTIEFQQLVKSKGDELWRDMPWRADIRPYYVLVSEIMLQQTQVSRVIPKFEEFVAKFPDETMLANANLADVLKSWQGLGYNRRAKYLHDAAKEIVRLGEFPRSQNELEKLPGVGKSTVGAIRAYAFNESVIFVETNIRTVYIHHFFADRDDVSDKEIAAKIEATIDRKNPRRFYQNLMDYGAWLKANGESKVAKSRHYKKQSKLAGSLREMRGEIIRRLSRDDNMVDLAHDVRYEKALSLLERDGLVSRTAGRMQLTK